MEKIRTSLFGYSKKQVRMLVESFENTIEVNNKNIEYLGEKCAELERISAKGKKNIKNFAQNETAPVFEIGKQVVEPIKDSLEFEKQ